MLKNLRSVLSGDDIKLFEDTAVTELDAGRSDSAQEPIEKLTKFMPRNRDAALALIRIVQRGGLRIEHGLDIFEKVFQVYRDDPEIAAKMGSTTDSVRDLDELNAAPSDSALFEELADVLEKLAEKETGGRNQVVLLEALATTTRMMGRQRDRVCERSYRRLVELDPGTSYQHYNLGLFFKTRGLFREGVQANQASARLREEPSEACEWNLGICATGAREGAAALEVWQRMGQKIRMGRFGLPEGGYPQSKVKLAERPLAERDADNDDPGLEETIWIERLSPCHGIVRSVLYQSLGVDYGDVVLFDGAPITYHRYGDTKVPVFPHLATLIRSGYRLYDFAGTQDARGQLANASEALAEDAVIYTHTEQFVLLCNACWRAEGTDHAVHEDRDEHVVVGRNAAPPGIDPATLLRQLDSAMADRAPCCVYAPTLCKAAGFADRADMEQRRFDMIVSARKR